MEEKDEKALKTTTPDKEAYSELNCASKSLVSFFL